MRSGADWAGWLVRQISGGVIASAGMKASISCCASLPRESLLALALELRARMISTWLPPCLPLVTPRRHDCSALDLLLTGRMWPTKGLRGSDHDVGGTSSIRSSW